MVDFQSQAKQWGYLYSAPTITDPVRSSRSFNRSLEPLLFKTKRIPAHDCHLSNIQDHRDPKTWDAYIMASGIKKTYDGINALHHKETYENDDGITKRKKLLFNIGQKGSDEGMLNFPRGLTVAGTGDIIIADTLNHRVQIFNMCAFFKDKFGKKGKEKGEFNQPTDVAVMDNGRIVVADSKNKRIQVFMEDSSFTYMFPTNEEPCYVTCDKSYNIIVSSMKRTIEVYSHQGELRQTFTLSSTGSPLPTPIAANNNEELVICDIADGRIKTFSYSGYLLNQFEPQSNQEGIACQPSGIALNPLGQILVADSLNRCVNLYSENGTLLLEVVNPSDKVGPVNACAVGPEGHLVITEISSNGVHCVKVFRYRDCKCHRTRPGSSKRPSRASAQVQSVVREHSPTK